MKEKLEKAGFKVIKEVNANQRFQSFLVEKDNQTFFAKTVVGAEKSEIDNEVWFAKLLTRLSQEHGIFPARTPQVIYQDEGLMVSEFFTEPLMLRSPSQAGKLEEFLPKINEVLLSLDNLPKVKNEIQPLSPEKESAPYNNLIKRIDFWMEKPLLEKLITPKEIEVARGIINKYREFVQPKFQHGDFTPWHMFNLEDGRIGLVDGEHASLLKPRFYDLAYFYTRVYTFLSAKKEAAVLLTLFLKESKLDKGLFEKAFLPVITLRSLGMFPDSLRYFEEIDYRPLARELLEKCFSEKLEEFARN